MFYVAPFFFIALLAVDRARDAAAALAALRSPPWSRLRSSASFPTRG